MDAAASMCRDGSLPSVPPPLLTILTDKATACGCRIVTSGRCVRTSRNLPFAHWLLISVYLFKIDWSICACLWRRVQERRGRGCGLVLSCTPKPLDTRCQLLVVPGGGLAGVVTECRKEEGRALVARQSQTFRREKRGNGDGQSGTA